MKTKRMVRVSSKGQIVLPKRLRDKLGIREGDYLLAEDTDSEVILIGKPSAVVDAILEPLRREAESQGFTREEAMDMIKAMRREQKSDAA